MPGRQQKEQDAVPEWTARQQSERGAGPVFDKLKKMEKMDQSEKAEKVEQGGGMNYEEFDAKCNEIRAENERYLEVFAEDISHLSDKTIRQHLDNVSFYLNEYLLRMEPLDMRNGAYELSGFLGDFFIYKCMWSTPATIKTTAASIRKFYKSMLAHGFIEQADYDFLHEMIKDRLKDWQAVCAAFNDPDADDFFLW